MQEHNLFRCVPNNPVNPNLNLKQNGSFYSFRAFQKSVSFQKICAWKLQVGLPEPLDLRNVVIKY